VEHLRRARLIAGAVVHEIGELLLGLRLIGGGTCAFETLGPGDRRHDRRQVGELGRLQSDQLIARLGGLQRAGCKLAR